MMRVVVIVGLGLGLSLGVLACTPPAQEADHAGQMDRALEMSAVVQTRAVWDALAFYRAHMGKYPSAESGLGALLPTATPPSRNWKGPYLPRIPSDAWGRPIHYHRDAEGLRIFSAGADGVTGTEDDVGEMRTWAQLQ